MALAHQQYLERLADLTRAKMSLGTSLAMNELAARKRLEEEIAAQRAAMEPDRSFGAIVGSGLKGAITGGLTGFAVSGGNPAAAAAGATMGGSAGALRQAGMFDSQTMQAGALGASYANRQTSPGSSYGGGGFDPYETNMSGGPSAQVQGMHTGSPAYYDYLFEQRMRGY